MMKTYRFGLLLLCVTLLNACVAYDQRTFDVHTDDAWLMSQINRRLVAEKDMPSRWIGVEVIEREVILTGYLPSQEHIDRAVYICENESHVKNVRNELQIGRPTIKRSFSDAAITASVKARLLHDEFVKGFSIHIETVNGKVYLQGMIEDIEQAYRAREIARETKGVRAVVNLLRVQNKK